ncbi:hypothetical protein PanNE5_36520 [Pandoraea sp. NE5]|uniref:hypothetical protein n=1 Tax=unclassified Pandoraea TaxID=2624094 RepID=UPI000962AF40|nr:MULTISPECIES: hypothetical protein [unclassified Pandoraea]OJY20809.1 MAG: hypothetical protein BGP02_10185 [Pandoraea sp. 64-18]BDD94212.1 hypothetical protein PanNE5_36520 [Pandoraea sp. NE5]
MSKALTPPLSLCKAQVFAALDAHRNWVENVQCLRQMQLKADEGLIEADKAFASALESASDFSALFNSQLAFMNQQLAMQNLIWQGLVKMSARGPTVWAEQYSAAQKAWQQVFSETAGEAMDTQSPANWWTAWGELTQTAMSAFGSLSDPVDQGAPRARPAASAQNAARG